MTNDELVTACHEHIQAQQAEQAAQAEDQEPVEPTGDLWITPQIVRRILQANKEE